MKKGYKILINIAVFATIIGFLWYAVSSIKGEKFADQPTASEHIAAPSSYDMMTKIVELPSEITAMDVYANRLYIYAGDTVYTVTGDGNILSRFHVSPGARDITADSSQIYILYPTDIVVYTLAGDSVVGWEACSELSDYCSVALAGEYLFVTDVQNKNICKYTTTGGFVKFINSPHGFIIPSYSFDITTHNDTLYVANAGRHLIESFTPDGEFIAAFGGQGRQGSQDNNNRDGSHDRLGGFFAGCSNPSYIAFSAGGDLITSEKGNPRISSYTVGGVFNKVLLNAKVLGGGNKAYPVVALGDRLIVAKAKGIYQASKSE